MVNELLLLGLALFGLALLYKLSWWSFAAIAGMICMTFWRLQRYRKKQQRAEARFYETSIYLENVLPAFARERKIDCALEAVCDALPEGELKKRLQTALLSAEGENEVSVAMVESQYSSDCVRRVHQFMMHAEHYAGNIDAQISLLLHACHQWKNRCLAAMKERRNQYCGVVRFTFCPLLICGIVVNMPFLPLTVDNNSIVQLVLIAIVAINCSILLQAKRSLVSSWGKLEKTQEREDGKRICHYQRYDAKKEKVLSIGLMIAGICAAMVLAYFGKYWLAFGVACLSVVMANGRRIGHLLLKKRIEKQLRLDFPEWLLDLSVLLEGNQVLEALEKSQKYAPESLRRELELLCARIAIMPDDFRPYSLFLKEFQLPEMDATMRMLYAISIGKQKFEDNVLEELVTNNDVMLASSEKDWVKEQLIKACLTAFALLFIGGAGLGLYELHLQAVEAQNFTDELTRELEESGFDQEVIADAFHKAKQQDYDLSIELHEPDGSRSLIQAADEVGDTSKVCQAKLELSYSFARGFMRVKGGEL